VIVDALAAGAERIAGLRLTEQQRESFRKYLKLIEKWQRVQRLVGSTDPAWLVEHLFLDSLLFLRLLPPRARRVADLGSGAGVPGIPIAIVRPDIDLTLIEARQRRVSFLSAAVRELGLAHTRVVEGRAEWLAGQIGGTFDAVLIRCAGGLEEVLPSAVGLTAAGGVVVASGPPKERPVQIGQWVEVQGIDPSSTRRFLVLQK
jgi:16S rRNA (guanine527-N7)-methyltransferase